MIGLDQLYMKKHSKTLNERNELEVIAGQLQGKYEGLLSMTEHNRAFTQELLDENRRVFTDQFKHIESTLKSVQPGGEVINTGLINMGEVKRANDNFNILMGGKADPSSLEFRKVMMENKEEKYKILMEKEGLKHERVLQSELERVRREHVIETEERRRKSERELGVYREEIKRLEIIRQENLSIILQKEVLK